MEINIKPVATSLSNIRHSTKLNQTNYTPVAIFSLGKTRQIIINRLKIGHTWVTYRHLMRQKQPDK